MVILATGITLLLLASALLKRVLIPNRIGTTPHCRRCNYNLSGLTPDPSTHCPECGLPLSPGNVVRGERPRGRPALLAAVLLAFAGLSLTLLPLYSPFRSVNWYAYKPAFWLLSDLESSDADVRARAWSEFTTRDANHHLSGTDRARFDALLVRLYAAGSSKLPGAAPEYLVDRFPLLTPDARAAVFQHLLTDLLSNIYTASADAQKWLERLESSNQLSPEHHARLARSALAAQADGQKHLALDFLLDYLGRRELAGQLTAEQRDQFFLGCFNPALELRPTVAAHDDVPYRLSFAGRAPEHYGWARTTLLTLQIDDRPPAHLGGSMSGGFPTGSSIGSVLRIDALGKHTVKVTIELAASPGQYPAGDEKVTPRWSRRVTQVGHVEILPPGTPDWTWIDDPTLADAIRRSLRPQNARASAKAWDAFAMTVQVNAPPANLAFEILARDASGKEHRIGELTAHGGDIRNIGVNAQTFPPGPNVGHVDLIFRSSEKVLKGTTTLYDAWRGEIVFPDVPVTPEPPAPSTPPR